MYELMSIWMEDYKGNRLKFEPSKLEGTKIMTDTESCMVGTAKEVIDYLLKGELRDYKLVKRIRKGEAHGKTRNII